MKALQFKVNIPKYLIQRTFSSRFHNLVTSPLSLISLREIPIPAPINNHWVRIRTLKSGICGTDLSILHGHSSFYLEPFSSDSFIPGHEIVGKVVEKSPAVKKVKEGDFVAVEPSLHCQILGIKNRCYNCQRGQTHLCLNLVNGHAMSGTSIGFSKESGGGWSEYFIAHQSQLYKIPSVLSPNEAVLVEPFSVAIHAVIRRYPPRGGTALIIGGGPIGLLTVAALKMLRIRCKIIVVAKYPYQRKFAAELGAHVLIDPTKEDVYEIVARETKAKILKPSLGKRVVEGGVNCVYDSIGSSATIDDALRVTRPGGTVVIVGSAGPSSGIDLTPVWFREVDLLGSYIYSVEYFRGKKIKTFDLAIDLLRRNKNLPLNKVVTHEFPLSRWKEAIETLTHRKKSNAVKVIFRFE